MVVKRAIALELIFTSMRGEGEIKTSTNLSGFGGGVVNPKSSVNEYCVLNV